MYLNLGGDIEYEVLLDVDVWYDMVHIAHNPQNYQKLFEVGMHHCEYLGEFCSELPVVPVFHLATFQFAVVRRFLQ